MTRKYYVTLTGSKNNAGDYLIRHRANELFSQIRPDRGIQDKDGWKPLSSSDLDDINNSEALILLGGPALQKRMRPRVYVLTDKLSDIRVPIITMGIGWYSPHSSWEETHKYSINSVSMELLERVNGEKYHSSVRDYHSANVLRSLGFHNFVMTGCPALYSLDHLGTSSVHVESPKRVGFSLGVSIKRSRRMERQMQCAILLVRDRFPNSQIDVLFHHGVGIDYLNSDGASRELYHAQERLRNWLEYEGVNYLDLSGSSARLIDYYTNCDFHIGYRIHAHIYMSSISKPSLLLIEDGRGEALKEVLGGVSLSAYRRVHRGSIATLLTKVGVKYDDMIPSLNFLKDFSGILDYEASRGVRLRQPRANIDLHYPVMKDFLKSLP